MIKEIAEVIVLANGDTISVSQFLEHFMFDSKMQYTPVSKLSGGEKRRLGLMMVLIKNPNFLILDEPTNDLDLITLEKLEGFLSNFGGCLIIVSHDRYFMDNLVEHYFVFEGNGVVNDFNGTYSEYRALKSEQESEGKSSSSENKKSDHPKPSNSDPEKLSFNERKEYQKLEKEIEELEKKKSAIHRQMSNSDLDYEKLQELSETFSALKEELEEKEFRWLELAERA